MEACNSGCRYRMDFKNYPRMFMVEGLRQVMNKLSNESQHTTRV